MRWKSTYHTFNLYLLKCGRLLGWKRDWQKSQRSLLRCPSTQLESNCLLLQIPCCISLNCFSQKQLHLISWKYFISHLKCFFSSQKWMSTIFFILCRVVSLEVILRFIDPPCHCVSCEGHLSRNVTHFSYPVLTSYKAIGSYEWKCEWGWSWLGKDLKTALKVADSSWLRPQAAPYPSEPRSPLTRFVSCSTSVLQHFSSTVGVFTDNSKDVIYYVKN